MIAAMLPTPTSSFRFTHALFALGTLAPSFVGGQTLPPTYSEPRRLSPVGTNYSAGTALDYDGDGDLDVIANLRPQYLSWLENKGNSFAAPTNLQNGYNSPIGNARMVKEDFDKDGDIDLIYPQLYNLWYCRSLGPGAGFAPGVAIYKPSFSSNGGFTSPAMVFDVDGDGWKDAVANSDGDLIWVKQTNGVFGTAKTISLNIEVTDMDSADIDRDGRIDIVYTHWSASQSGVRLSWLRNLGSGSFAAPALIDNPANDTRLVRVADVDRDGWVDVVTAGFTRKEVRWRRRIPNAGWGSPVFMTNNTDGTQDLDVADLDNDGDLDVVVTSDLNSRIMWFRNNGSGFGSENVLTTAILRPEWVEPSDLDHDGDLDFVACGGDGQELFWIENENDPPFAVDIPTLVFVEDTPPQTIPLAPLFRDPQDAVGTLTYQVVNLNGSSVLSSAVIGTDGRSLVVGLAKDGHGNATIGLRATDPRGLSVDVQVPVRVTQLVDLGVTAISDRSWVEAPGTATHTITVKNHGPSDATQVDLTFADIHPPSVVSTAPQASAGSIVNQHWKLPLLAEGSSATLVFTYDVPASARGGIASLSCTASLESIVQPATNPTNDSATVVTGILSPVDVSLVHKDASPILDRQSGLLIQRIVLGNLNPADLGGLRLIIGNLPAGVQVKNADGTRPDGTAFIESRHALAVGAEVIFSVEFYRPDRSAKLSPVYHLETVYSVTQAPLPVAAAAPAPERFVKLENGDYLLEFSSVPGRSYAIEYSSDAQSWLRASPIVVAASNRTQWIDNGQPKTPSHPSMAPTRFYRVVELAE